LNAADRTIANDGAGNSQLIHANEKRQYDQLPADIDGRKIPYFRKLNRRVSYDTNEPHINIKQDEFNQI